MYLLLDFIDQIEILYFTQFKILFYSFSSSVFSSLLSFSSLPTFCPCFLCLFLLSSNSFLYVLLSSPISFSLSFFLRFCFSFLLLFFLYLHSLFPFLFLFSILLSFSLSFLIFFLLFSVFLYSLLSFSLSSLVFPLLLIFLPFFTSFLCFI